MSLIPTKLFINEKGLAKIEIAIGKGKKLYDKRENIKKNEVLLIAGKGHEDYQEINGKKNKFSDYKEVKKCLKEIKY